MLKKLIFTGLLGLSSLLHAKINVVVSILPQQTFVEKIGGEKVHVTTMVKPGSDPHTYSPKPSQMKALSNAQVYFPIKVEFENAWLEKFIHHNKEMKLSNMTKDIQFITLETAPYEWAGAFELEEGEYHWSFSKIAGKYANPKMKFLILEAPKDNDDLDELIEQYKDKAEALFNSNKITSAKNNDGLPTQGTVYQLNFDETKDQTHFRIKIKKSGTYLFFTEHMPFEFKNKEHYFKDIAQYDIKAITSKPKIETAHHHHGGVDPHTWTIPANVKIMAKNIYDTLTELDSQNSDYYQKNYEDFLKEIEQTDKKIKEILSPLPQKSTFMVFHPSWEYFAREYGLIQLAIEVEGKEPKPKMLQKIIDKARKHNIKAIFTQPEFSDRSTQAIARELNIKVLKETPLAKNWSQNLINKAHAIANNH